MSALLLVIMASGCRSAGYERAASERFDGAVTFDESADGSFVLAIERRADGIPDPSVRFFLYDVERDTVTYESAAPFHGTVSWHDATHVLVNEVAGAAQQGGPNGRRYVIDARSGALAAPEDGRP